MASNPDSPYPSSPAARRFLAELIAATSSPNVLQEFRGESAEKGPKYLAATLPAAANTSKDQWEKDFDALLRKYWLHGRSRTLFLHWLTHLDWQKIRATDIAEKLSFNRSAISQWVQGNTVVGMDNLELVRRWFREELEGVRTLSENRLDIAGYSLAMARVKQNLRGEGLEDDLAVRDFWTLWFFFRSKGIRHALLQNKKRELSDLINNIRKQVDSLRFLNPIDHRTDRDPPGHSEEEYREHVLKLVRSWGSAYLVVLTHLDDVLWTGLPTTSFA